MSITGLCQICESAEAEFQCGRCGALVCEAHYDRERAVCVNCLAEMGGGGRGEGGDRDGRPDTHRL